MSTSPATMVSLLAASHAGELAAKLRKKGRTPEGEEGGNPFHHGARQWIEAVGIEGLAEQNCFSAAFYDELRRPEEGTST